MAERDSEVGPFERLWEEWRSESRNRDAVKRGKLRVTWDDVIAVVQQPQRQLQVSNGLHSFRKVEGSSIALTTVYLLSNEGAIRLFFLQLIYYNACYDIVFQIHIGYGGLALGFISQ